MSPSPAIPVAFASTRTASPSPTALYRPGSPATSRAPNSTGALSSGPSGLLHRRSGHHPVALFTAAAALATWPPPSRNPLDLRYPSFLVAHARPLKHGPLSRRLSGTQPQPPQRRPQKARNALIIQHLRRRRLQYPLHERPLLHAKRPQRLLVRVERKQHASRFRQRRQRLPLHPQKTPLPRILRRHLRTSLPQPPAPPRTQIQPIRRLHAPIQPPHRPPRLQPFE